MKIALYHKIIFLHFQKQKTHLTKINNEEGGLSRVYNKLYTANTEINEILDINVLQNISLSALFYQPRDTFETENSTLPDNLNLGR